jgi:hypothetical protein
LILPSPLAGEGGERSETGEGMVVACGWSGDMGACRLHPPLPLPVREGKRSERSCALFIMKNI